MRYFASVASLAMLLACTELWAGGGSNQERKRYQEFLKNPDIFSCPKGTSRIMQPSAVGDGDEEFCMLPNGVRAGYYLRWYPGSKAWAVLGNYKNGKKDGRWVQFAKDGRVKSRERYSAGRRLKTKPVDEAS